MMFTLLAQEGRGAACSITEGLVELRLALVWQFSFFCYTVGRRTELLIGITMAHSMEMKNKHYLKSFMKKVCLLVVVLVLQPLIGSAQSSFETGAINMEIQRELLQGGINMPPFNPTLLGPSPSITTVPEPGTLALGVLGLSAIIVARRMRKSRNESDLN
jgi:hypothetical protein